MTPYVSGESFGRDVGDGALSNGTSWLLLFLVNTLQVVTQSEVHVDGIKLALDSPASYVTPDRVGL